MKEHTKKEAKLLTVPRLNKTHPSPPSSHVIYLILRTHTHTHRTISRAEIALCTTRACVLDISAAAKGLKPKRQSNEARRSVKPAAWLRLPFSTILKRMSGKKVLSRSKLKLMKSKKKARLFSECIVRELPELIALKGGYIALYHDSNSEEVLRLVHELLLICNFPSVSLLLR